MPEYSGQVTHVELAWIPLWLIPLLAFTGAVVNAFFGTRLQQLRWGQGFAKRHHIGSLPVSLVGVGAVALAFMVSAFDVVQLVSHFDQRAWISGFQPQNLRRRFSPGICRRPGKGNP